MNTEQATFSRSDFIEQVQNHFEKSCKNCANYSPDDETECAALTIEQADKLFDLWEDQYETLSCSGKNLDVFMAARCKKWQKKK